MQELIRSALDPTCDSGHFLLAAARRLAEQLAQLRAPDGAVQPQDYRHALREVIARCIFGVDRKPMATELPRTALWLEGFEEGRPLSFLDHHLQVSDALLGAVSRRIACTADSIPRGPCRPPACPHLGKPVTPRRPGEARTYGAPMFA